MNVLSDIVAFIKALTFMDFVFFGAVVVLMLLVIILIYFLKENEIDIEEVIDKPNKEEDSPLWDLKTITEALNNKEVENNFLNNYENEQEEKAIISYDELVKRKADFALNYSEEENITDDLTIKKVDLDNLVNKNVEEVPNLKVQIISYEKEEAFLEALKALQELLN